MTGKEALLAYGYSEFPDGRFRKMGRFTQVWEPTKGGWFRYETTPEGEVKEVYQIKETHQGVSGLDKSFAPEAFEWVYPDEVIAKIYSDAAKEAAEGWPTRE